MTPGSESQAKPYKSCQHDNFTHLLLPVCFGCGKSKDGIELRQLIADLEGTISTLTTKLDLRHEIVEELEKQNAEFIEYKLKSDGELKAIIHHLESKLKSTESPLAESEKECEEQARLNGMGAQREAALLAKVEQLLKERDSALAMLEELKGQLRFSKETESALAVALEDAEGKFIKRIRSRKGRRK